VTPIESQEQADRIQAMVLANRNYGLRTIEFIDGPLAGTIHEVQAGWPCPCAIEVLLDDGTSAIYDVCTETGGAMIREIA
jgi:hypothetical protein